jgi:hypothetical protein
MKRITIAILATLLTFGGTLFAQSNDWTLAYQNLKGGLLGLEPTKTTEYSLYAGYGQNTSSGQQIEALMLTAKQPDAVAGLGVAGAHIGKTWQYGGANVTFGRNDNLPILGDCREYIGEGVIYDFRTHEPANYFLTGVDKDWIVFKTHHIGFGAVLDHRSNASGVDIIGGAHGSF